MTDNAKTPKQENEKNPSKKPDEKLQRPEATLDEAPAGGPNAEERSRLAD
jgi:hypothetical protein